MQWWGWLLVGMGIMFLIQLVIMSMAKWIIGRIAKKQFGIEPELFWGMVGALRKTKRIED